MYCSAFSSGNTPFVRNSGQRLYREVLPSAMCWELHVPSDFCRVGCIPKCHLHKLSLQDSLLLRHLWYDLQQSENVKIVTVALKRVVFHFARGQRLLHPIKRSMWRPVLPRKKLPPALQLTSVKYRALAGCWHLWIFPARYHFLFSYWIRHISQRTQGS